MGLLGDSWDDPKTMATLQLASGLLSSGNFGENLSAGLRGYQGVMGAQKAQALEDMKAKLYGAQIEETQAQALQRKAEAAKVQEALKREAMFRASMGEAVRGQADVPALDVGAALPGLNAGLPPVPGRAGKPIDYQALLAQYPEQAALIKQLAEAKDLGRPEVARTIEAVDGNGRPVTRQFDKFGNPVGGDLQQWKQPMSVSQGDRTTFVNPATMQPMGSLPINMSASERDSSARGWAGLTLQEKNQNAPQFHNGEWVSKPTSMAPNSAMMPQGGQAVRDSNDALSLISQAKAILPNATGSGIGSWVDAGARFVGGTTDGAEAAAQLKAVSGALVAKMPKMSGPQSDKDVALYKEAAGAVGDETKTVKERMAALQVVEAIQKRYAAGLGGSPVDNLLSKYLGK